MRPSGSFPYNIAKQRKGRMNVSPVSDSPGNKRRREYSGIYPHLSVSNKGNSECGIGALAAWNGELWYITYPAHEPEGSDDKLYCLDSSMNVRICPESVGGTHANRMVHRESNQLNIGLYFIDDRENIRVISPHRLRGRCTASARHLTDPENKIYIMTMEEGLYEVNVHTQEVKTLLPDKADTRSGILPGTHGKGACSGQGRLIYSNNGRGGVLAEWDGKEDPGKPESWTIIDRNKYTEITSRGGICGSPEKEDVIWALGWDDKSVLLRICEDGKWDRYRLPKASFTYDADHGWYTEWPRIRSIGRKKLLMDMHGMFYEFPDTFCRSHTAGIRPIARHLKMVADFTDWNGRIAMAADDASMMQNPFWDARNPICGLEHLRIFCKWENLPDGAESGTGKISLPTNRLSRSCAADFKTVSFISVMIRMRRYPSPWKWTGRVQASGKNMMSSAFQLMAIGIGLFRKTWTSAGYV